MSYQIMFHPSALQDLQAIQTYISQNLNNPSSASKIISKIIQKCQSLELFPKEAPVRFKIHNQPIRLLHVLNYIIAYNIDDTKNTVYIQAIIYKHRNLSRLLSKLT